MLERLGMMVILSAWFTVSIARGDSGDAPPPDQFAPATELISPAARQLIDRGLLYLSEKQRPDGSFGSGQWAGNIAVSALAGLAFLSSGSTPEEGPYSGQLSRIVDYVLSNTSASGFVVYQQATSHGPMYDHGFGTLFLAEIYGMTDRQDVREKLKKAVNLIVYTQNDQGGWRYEPRRVPDADISVTICQIMALRAARNAGIAVPRGTVDRCTQYVKQSQNPDGGFRYMLDPGQSGFPRSAAGVVALHNAGIYEGGEIDRGVEYLLKFNPARQRGQESHYFYGHYYAALAMYQAGGRMWNDWYMAIRDDLISRARASEGSWMSSGVCPEYGTAMALIILQMPNNYLPIFQR
jgi:hypothetical protein